MQRHEIPCREHVTDFDVRWHDGDLTEGVTALLRVKDEARNLPWVLPPLLEAVDHVVLVDNGSTDGTAEVAREVATDAGAREQLEVLDYPHKLARCGSEHLATPPDSVHSLVHFNNWALSKVRTSYVVKWDGDMILSQDGVRILSEIGSKLEGARSVLSFPYHAFYVTSPSTGYVDPKMRRSEIWGWPNDPAFYFGKGFEWELILHPPDVTKTILPEWVCFEVKWTDDDEFDHWATRDFDQNPRTRRKQREWHLFTSLRSDDVPPSLERIASVGDHVLDLVSRAPRSSWVPRVEVASEA